MAFNPLLSRRQSAARRLLLPGTSGRRPAVVAAACTVAEAGVGGHEDSGGGKDRGAARARRREPRAEAGAGEAAGGREGGRGAEGKRKAECETLIAQIGKLNSQAAAEAETAKGREENLTIALGAARETVEKVVHALQTLQTGFQQLVSSGAFQSGPLQWNVRNVSGAANFAINQLVELSKSVGTSVGKEEE